MTNREQQYEKYGKKYHEQKKEQDRIRIQKLKESWLEYCKEKGINNEL